MEGGYYILENILTDYEGRIDALFYKLIRIDKLSDEKYMGFMTITSADFTDMITGTTGRTVLNRSHLYFPAGGTSEISFPCNG
ncbi:MAG: hypothetical protein HUJ54_06755 [Erysipelotrichaceae bacterium]|nr:hypothetical protein [Erysipelotrichaceae bacterium]